MFVFCMGRLVNSVGCLLPRPSQDLQQPQSCSHAPADVGGLTCYSSVTSQDGLLSWRGTAQHPSPSPPRTPLHSVPLVAASCLVTCMAGGQGWGQQCALPDSLIPVSLFSFLHRPPSFLYLGSRLGSRLGRASPLPQRPSSLLWAWEINECALAPASCAVCLGTDCFPAITTGCRSGWWGGGWGRYRGRKTPIPAVPGGSPCSFPLRGGFSCSRPEDPADNLFSPHQPLPSWPIQEGKGRPGRNRSPIFPPFTTSPLPISWSCCTTFPERPPQARPQQGCQQQYFQTLEGSLDAYDLKTMGYPN